jgi:conjugative transfer signal peptidase TraF
MSTPARSLGFRIGRAVSLAATALFLAVWGAYLAGARINRTNSLPKGLYRTVDKPPERGDIVAFWPRDTAAMREARRRGYILPGVYNTAGGEGYGFLLKRLMGVSGDIVSVTDGGVAVNGALVPNTRPLDADNIGDPLPKLRFESYRLGANEVLLVSDHLPRSFDGRYFGIQERYQIVETLVPVWTW